MKAARSPSHLARAAALHVPARALVRLARRAARAERVDLARGFVHMRRVGAHEPAVLRVEAVVGVAHGGFAGGLVHVADVVNLSTKYAR